MSAVAGPTLISDFFDLAQYQHKALFSSCEYPWQVLDNIASYCSQFPLGRIEGKVSPQAYLENKEQITLLQGSVVEPGAYIKGPCIIGANSVVRHGAYIRGNVIVGNDCVVGHDTEIKGSILLDHVRASHFAYIGDSIIGNYVNLGAGFICANVRLDKIHIVVAINVEGERVATGRKKLGAMIGDATQTGCNGVANPGTIIGRNVKVGPTLNIRGFVPSYTHVQSPVAFNLDSI